MAKIMASCIKLLSSGDKVLKGGYNQLGRGGGGRSVKKKQHGLANDAAKDVVNVVSSTVESPAVDEHMVASGNTKGTEDGNVGQGVKSTTTTAPNIGYVLTTIYESPTIDNYGPIRFGPTSYAKLVTGEPSRKSVNFRTLIAPGANGVDVAIPVESILAISERFANITYGFFLGKRVAYPVVANYVKNSWSKYGLVKSMLSSSNGYFSTNLAWNPNVILQNQDVGNVPVWVKFHGVPMTAYSEDGLSIIATKLVSDVVKNLNNPEQATKGVLIGPKVSIKRDDDYNPYDDNLYKSHDTSEHL
ncbi:hypothetical protein Tco_0678432 [Tanacetum coccineum]|uniref:DUF4283 domain-containing protein n=1 Tax=Tanacetum coccineum TaxID=301880 RepID=A0ABQ4XF40_9ASTR